MADPLTSQSPLRDAIDTHSGRFEFLKQTLTLASAGIAGIAALFTDSTRIPADALSKGTVLAAALSLIAALYYSVTGLSTYANILTTTAKEAANIQTEHNVAFYVDGLRHHARGVIVSLFFAFFFIVLFAGYRLYVLPTVGPAGAAIEAASDQISKQTKQPVNSLYLARLETDSDTFIVTFFVAALNTDSTVRISKKDGSIIGITQSKRPPTPGTP